jgi:LCP family protein required for cell wall assembly
MKEKSSKRKNRKYGIMLAVLQLTLTAVMIGLAFELSIFPNKYLIVGGIIAVIMAAATIFTQWSGKLSKTGKVVSVLMCIVLMVGSNYLYKMNSMLSEVQSDGKKIDNVSVLVLPGDKAKNIEDAKNYTFGIQQEIDRDNTNQTIQKIKDELGTDIKTKEYSDFNDQMQALNDGEVNAIILNENLRGVFLETIARNENKNTKVIFSNQIERALNIEKCTKNVAEEPFTVYISGIDGYSLNKDAVGRTTIDTGFSDANIIATVNPKTKKIMLLVTPRDTSVTIPNTGGQKDKLTRAGFWGVDTSMTVLENLYGIKIDYYVQADFESLTKIVDALGGINVVSDYAFTNDGSTFKAGENQLNGTQALAFARERLVFKTEDMQRSMDNLSVLEGVLKKCESPAILKGADQIISSVSSDFDTNISKKDLARMIKAMADKGYSLEISKNIIDGQGIMTTDTYTGKGHSYFVMIPDAKIVEHEKLLMQEVIQGK